MITITDEIAQRVTQEINQQPWGANCSFDKDGRLLAVDHGAWSFPEGRRWGMFGSAPMPLTMEQVRERLERREKERARWLAWRNGTEE